LINKIMLHKTGSGQNQPGQYPPWTKSSEFGQTSITYINLNYLNLFYGLKN